MLSRFVWMNYVFNLEIRLVLQSQALMEWVRLHAESVTGRMGYSCGYKKDIELDMLDPTGVVVEKWILQGTFLTNINFGDLDYSRDDIATIECSLRMDRCIQVY